MHFWAKSWETPHQPPLHRETTLGEKSKHMENKILLNISAKVSYPHGSFLVTVHYIHIPCDIDCVHSHM